MVKIKICGITNTDDAVFCSKVGADALGFIFYKQSPRYIAPRKAKKVMKELGPFVLRAGVFVDEDKNKVEEIAEYLNLNILQFHGKESPSYCNYFLKRFSVIKVFFPPHLPNEGYARVNAYLFDIKLEDKEKRSTLDDNFLKKVKEIKTRKVILSGGITPFNISRLIKKVKPYAVDVARGVEASPGIKDKKLVKSFIREVKFGELENYESS